jgi:hypothetical protein
MKPRLRLLPILLCLSPLPPLAAGATEPASVPATLGEWLARDIAAGRASPSPARDAELAALQRAVVDALQAARAAEEARAAAGETPRACLPPPGTAQLSSQDIGRWLHARPGSEYGEPMARIIAGFLAERFPCP